MASQISLVAGGAIEAASFIKLSAAADYTALQAGSNERTFGITVDAAQAAPIPGASNDAAASGDLFRYFSVGDECLLQLGGTVTRGDMVISDASGFGVTAGAYASATPQYVGAEAMESGVSGDKIRVRVINYVF